MHVKPVPIHPAIAEATAQLSLSEGSTHTTCTKLSGDTTDAPAPADRMEFMLSAGAHKLRLVCISLDCEVNRNNSHRQQGEHPLCKFLLLSIKLVKSATGGHLPDLSLHVCVCACVCIRVSRPSPSPSPCFLVPRALFYRHRADICWSSG